jgi:hypothetical protein
MTPCHGCIWCSWLSITQFSYICFLSVDIVVTSSLFQSLFPAHPSVYCPCIASLQDSCLSCHPLTCACYITPDFSMTHSELRSKEWTVQASLKEYQINKKITEEWVCMKCVPICTHYSIYCIKWYQEIYVDYITLHYITLHYIAFPGSRVTQNACRM